MVCDTCEKQVLGKLIPSIIIGLPLYGVGSLLTGGLGYVAITCSWEYKGKLGQCARCDGPLQPTPPEKGIAVEEEPLQPTPTEEGIVVEEQNIQHVTKEAHVPGLNDFSIDEFLQEPDTKQSFERLATKWVASKFQVSEEKVVITDISSGSLNIKYKLQKLTFEEKERLAHAIPAAEEGIVVEEQKNPTCHKRGT